MSDWFGWAGLDGVAADLDRRGLLSDEQGD
jgi:hypothetical protein